MLNRNTYLSFLSLCSHEFSSIDIGEVLLDIHFLKISHQKYNILNKA
jgi:hypothetical protein